MRPVHRHDRGLKALHGPTGKVSAAKLCDRMEFRAVALLTPRAPLVRTQTSLRPCWLIHARLVHLRLFARLVVWLRLLRILRVPLHLLKARRAHRHFLPARAQVAGDPAALVPSSLRAALLLALVLLTHRHRPLVRLHELLGARDHVLLLRAHAARPQGPRIRQEICDADHDAPADADGIRHCRHRVVTRLHLTRRSLLCLARQLVVWARDVHVLLLSLPPAVPRKLRLQEGRTRGSQANRPRGRRRRDQQGAAGSQPEGRPLGVNGMYGLRH
mmetsp:Transcript_6543/g.16932  ORF Transcript_6543/g.16932 Transcript_6543/m.16932 type:complete len:273 (+) Transcript_6543:295-1113(+)